MAQPFEKPYWPKYLQHSGEICFKTPFFSALTSSKQEAAHRASAGEAPGLKKEKLQAYAHPKRP